MNRRNILTVSLLLVLSAALRYALIPHVGVFGDFGYWAYDSRMILHGEIPYIDFTGRSPLTVYSLAAIRSVFGMSVWVMRGAMIAFWTATAGVVYLIARDIRGHRVGVLAVLLATLTPVPVVYGMWLNSQSQAALAAVLAVYVLLRRESLPAYAISGGLLGLGFLARRSTFMVGVGIGLWTIWRHYDGRDRLFQSAQAVLARGVAMVGVMAGVIFAGYATVMRWRLDRAVELFWGEAIGLIYSNGVGSYPLLGVEVPTTAPPMADSVPVFNWLCQLCGAWTARVGLKMIILAFPVAAFLWWYARDITAAYFTETERQYLGGALVMLWAYGLYLTVTHGLAVRSAFLVALLGVALAAIYGTDRLDREVLYSPGAALLLSVVAAVVVAYLYRDRRIHVYYLMDVWPYYAILGAIVFERVYERTDPTGRTALAVMLALALLVATVTATPFTAIAFGENAPGFMTVAGMAYTESDLETRTDPGDLVFSARPNYVTGTHARLPADISRSYKIALEYYDTVLADRLYGALRRGFQSGTIAYVVLNDYTGDVLAWDKRTERLFESRYCLVNAAEPVYAPLQSHLYEPRTPCPTQRPNVSAGVPPWAKQNLSQR